MCFVGTERERALESMRVEAASEMEASFVVAHARLKAGWRATGTLGGAWSESELRRASGVPSAAAGGPPIRRARR
jgi:hypothetical protein